MGSGRRDNQAATDLSEDLRDLAALAQDQVDRLAARVVDLRRPGSGVPDEVLAETAAVADRLVAAYQANRREIDRLIGHGDPAATAETAAGLRRIAGQLRARQCLAAAVLVGSDWHSPSISHSLHSSAGRHAGRVTGHVDDYKRDRHPDAEGYERRWLSEMVDNPHGHRLRALLTASGMAAVTTVLDLVGQVARPGPILLGRSTYHESRQLVQTSALCSRVRLVTEDDQTAWDRATAPVPAAVVVDSSCNSTTMATTDVPALIGRLDRTGRPVVLVVDNTGCSVRLQPWQHLRRGSAVRLVVVESLTKYAQLGLDRTAAGMIVAAEPLAGRIDESREHLGTNIADVAVEQLPLPDRARLERRLARIGRNARIVAGTLDERVRRAHLPLVVAHPGAGGGLIAISPTVRQPTTELLGRLVKSAIATAAERGIDLCEGSSFGFDTTRLYLTATTTRYGKPFLRVSAGTENARAITEVANAIADAMEDVA